MSDPRRNLLAQGAIALAVCLGGYMVFVEPARQSLSEERAKAASLESQVREAEAVQHQIPQVAAALAAATAESTQVAQMGELARDERRLYGALMASAERHRVQIDQLNPAKFVGQAAAGAKDDPASARDKAIAYSISAAGAYADIAAFVKSLQSELGYSLVRSVSIAPRAEVGDDQVRAGIDTAHFYFDPNPAGPAPAQQVAGAPGGN